MQGILCLIFKRKPCQTQAVFIEPILCACEIRISLGVHAVDHYFTIIKQFLGEKSDVCIQESLEQSRHAEISPGSESGPWALERKSKALETLEEGLDVATPRSANVLMDFGGDGHKALSQSSSSQEGQILGGSSHIYWLMLATVCLLYRTNVAQKCPDFSHINLYESVHFSIYPFPPWLTMALPLP